MIVFNHSYKLKHDEKRTFVLGPEQKLDNSYGAKIGWISVIHPIYAMIFSFISKPVDIRYASESIASFLQISEDSATDLFQRLISSEPVYIDYGGAISSFPPNLIIASDDIVHQASYVEYCPEQFVYKDVDLKRQRPYSSPLGIVLMINNVCSTNCVYCYADKTMLHPTMPWSVIEKVVSDARQNNINSFQITGGEIFLYKDWPKLLALLCNYGYKPGLLSTKVPLTEEQIQIFQKFQIKLQISLDSYDPRILSSILNVGEDYRDKIVHTIELLEKYKIQYQVATVITKHNESIESLDLLYYFLNTKKMITRWEIRLAFKSLYSRNDFESIKATDDAVSKIEEWIKVVRNGHIHNCNIMWSRDNGRTYFKCSTGSRNFPGSRCSANYSHMIILPDGKVTICEQLYWMPKFIIGDVTKDNICDIWNSEQAIKLAFRKQSDINDKSACRTCELWDNCSQYPNQCIADIIKGYGEEYWDFPDPRCSYAPPFYKSM